MREAPAGNVEVTADTVREALHALRYSQPLGDSPLVELAFVSRRLEHEGLTDAPGTRGWALSTLLHELVAGELDRLRGTSLDWGEITAAEATSAFESDFSSDSRDREGWGALYLRYLAPVDRPVAVAGELGVPQRTLYRRVLRGCNQLARQLRQRESETLLEAPGASPSPPEPARRGLPHQATSLVGRARDLEEVAGLLASSRLLTLTGPGGTGKTRLAIQLAAQAADGFADGVAFVDLAPLEDGALVAEAVVAELGAAAPAGRQGRGSLLDCLGDQELLVILDNCEHVLDGAAAVAEEALAHAPGVRIVATSREPLRAAGERLWMVPPLALPALPASGAPPDPSVLLSTSAVQLFVERARNASPGFALDGSNAVAVARLCVALDGLPLALELSAARVRALPPGVQVGRFDQLMGQLGGGRRVASRRQQTLESALDWSYELLDPRERLLFDRLAVFKGGWTLEAAEAIASGGALEEWQVLGLLGSLVDKSLVTVATRAGHARYAFLETIAAYARSRLEESGAKERAGRRHLAHHIRLAQAAAARGRNAPDLDSWLKRLDAENDNFRAAVATAHGLVDPGSGLQLGSALGWSFYPRGQLREGRRLLRSVLRIPGAEAPTRDRALVLQRLGTLETHLSHFEESRASLLEAVAIYEELGDEAAVAHVEIDLAIEALLRGDYDTARSYLERSRSVLGDTSTIVPNLALVAMRQEDYDTSRTLYEETLAGARAEQSPWLIGHALVNLASIERRVGNLEASRDLFEEGLAVKRGIDDRTTVAYAEASLGHVSLDQGRVDEGYQRFAEAARLAGETGNRLVQVDAVAGLGRVAELDGDPVRAAKLLGAVEAAWDALRVAPSPVDRADLERLTDVVRRQVGDQSFEDAHQAGARLDLDAAIELGLAGHPSQRAS